MMLYNSADSLILDQTETPNFFMVNGGWYFIGAIIGVTEKPRNLYFARASAAPGVRVCAVTFGSAPFSQNQREGFRFGSPPAVILHSVR